MDPQNKVVEIRAVFSKFGLKIWGEGPDGALPRFSRGRTPSMGEGPDLE